MSKLMKALLIVNSVWLVWNVFSATAGAQRPPQANSDGVPYLNVNINPTPVPPLVNINPTSTPPVVDINPRGAVPRVEISSLPRLQIESRGCASGNNFQTSVGNSIVGPLTVTYLNVHADTLATLVDPQKGTQRFSFAGDTPLVSAIYLRTGQQLNFEKSVFYSGCRPE